MGKRCGTDETSGRDTGRPYKEYDFAPDSVEEFERYIAGKSVRMATMY